MSVGEWFFEKRWRGYAIIYKEKARIEASGRMETDKGELMKRTRILIPVPRWIMILFLFWSGMAPAANASNSPGVPGHKMGEISSSQSWVNIAGIWESNIGWKYDIKQKGSTFTWTVVNRNQKATGTISENNEEIEVKWIDNDSRGTAKGLILEVDKEGKATFIEWDNGVFFHRVNP